MTDIITLRADLETLKSSRRSGALRVRIENREVLYRSDEEIRDAIAALEAEIAGLEGPARSRTINIRSRGWS